MDISVNFLHSFHSRYISKYFDILSEFIFLAFFLHENSGELIFKQFFLCLAKAFSEDWKEILQVDSVKEALDVEMSEKDLLSAGIELREPRNCSWTRYRHYHRDLSFSYPYNVVLTFS